MKIAIHQPQYLPWLPYLMKAAECDQFIILDSVAFQKNGLQNRNRIKTSKGPHWLTVPVKQRLGQLVSEVVIDNSADWRRKHWETLKQNYRKAPAFASHSAALEKIYATQWSRLADLNIALFEFLMRGLGLAYRTALSSEMKAAGKASELVLNLCLEARATVYVSGEGGKDYLDEKAFQDAGISVVYEPPFILQPYPQLFPEAGFHGDLSSLDVLLNCGSDWRRYLPGPAEAHARP